MWRQIFAFALVAITASLAQEQQDQPKLLILPSESKIRKDLDKNGFFTCRAADGFEDLMEDLVWVDPQGIEVPSESQQSTDQPGNAPRIYTSEYIQGQGRELFMNPIKQQDSGMYTCRARYATSQEITKSFELVVYMSIRFVDAPEEQNPITGSEAKIKCVVQANPVAVVEWFKDGRLLRSGGRYVVEQDGLVIQDITSEDDGTYVCRAKVQEEGEIEERRIQVEVHSQPEILEPEQDAEFEVVEKEATSIPCRTSGKPVPEITWVDPDNADVSTIPGLSVDPKDGTLNFDPATRDMGGIYKCIAENAVGRVETGVNVVVIVKPEINRYENVTVDQEKTATLECRVAGSPLPEVSFRKLSNDVPFTEGTAPGDPRISVTQREEDGFRIGSLQITELRRTDDGLYECIGTNKGGRELKNGHITTQFTPDFTNSPIREIYSWNNNQVNLTCVAESIPNATITWEFKRRLLEQDLDSNIQQIGNGPTSVLQVTPTDPTYYGDFLCKASNILGQNSLTIRLFEATVPAALTDVDFEEVTATTITFDISRPSSDGGLPLIAYAVQYKEAGQSWEADSRQEAVWPVGTSYVLDKLRPQSVYVFRFSAKNDVGLGEWSAEQQMVTPKIDVPEPPIILLPDTVVQPGEEGDVEVEQDVIVNSVFPDAYTVQWQAGASNGEKIDSFEISYYEVQATKQGWRSVSEKHSSVVDFPGNHMFKVQNLKPENHYRIELRAHNKIGFGRPAEVIVLTAKGAKATSNSTGGADSTTAASVTPLGISLLLLLASRA